MPVSVICLGARMADYIAKPIEPCQMAEALCGMAFSTQTSLGAEMKGTVAGSYVALFTLGKVDFSLNKRRLCAQDQVLRGKHNKRSSPLKQRTKQTRLKGMDIRSLEPHPLWRGVATLTGRRRLHQSVLFVHLNQMTVSRGLRQQA